MVTVAPDTTALVESDTVPVISAVGVCPQTVNESTKKHKVTDTLVNMHSSQTRLHLTKLIRSESFPQ